MTVIDKILNEWSFRCHDGIVDMNDPIKVSILNEILEQYNLLEQEQSIDDKIKAIISGLKDEEKEKIYKSLIKTKNKINKVEDESDKIKDFLIRKKQIPESIADYIILKAEDQDQIEELKNTIDEITFSQLPLEGNLNEYTKEKIKNISWLNDLNISQAGLSLGKGEILLAILFKEAHLSTSTQKKIDIIVGSTGNTAKVEIKQNGAVISKEGRSSEYKKMWFNNNLTSKTGEKISFYAKWIEDWSKSKTLLSTWTPIYDRFQELDKKNLIQVKEYISDINSLLPNYGIKGDLTAGDFNDLKTLCKKVAYLAVGDYAAEKKIILMNSNLDYIILNNKNIEDQIINNNDIHTDTSFIPRISY